MELSHIIKKVKLQMEDQNVNKMLYMKYNIELMGSIYESYLKSL